MGFSHRPQAPHRLVCATFGALVPLLGAAAADAQTQAVSAPSGDPIRWSVSARAQLTDATSVTVGGLYFNDLNTAVPFVLVDHQIGEHWSLQGGYLLAIRELDDGPDRTIQFIRFGATYRQTDDRFTFDNRLAHEFVVDDQRRDTGGRIRNRMRLSYAPDLDGIPEPRLFGYVEPVAEYGLGRPSRFDAAIGAGLTPLPGLRIDAYVLSQTYAGHTGNSVEAFMVEVQLQARARSR